MLATSDDALMDKLEEFAKDLERQVDVKNRALKSQL
jgi:phosphoribosylcarboxyaminoimidazole (NCAIR) mutase